MELVTVERVRAAQKLLSTVVQQTPMEHSRVLGEWQRWTTDLPDTEIFGVGM